MGARFFFARVIGSGVGTLDDGGDPLRPAVHRHTPFVDVIYGDNVECFVEAGYMTADEYVAVQADPDCVEILPAERPNRKTPEYIEALKQPLNTYPLSVLQDAADKMEARGIPTEGIVLSDSLASVIRKIYRRMVIKRRLAEIDFSVNLNIQLSSIPAARRAAIADKLRAHGFNVSVLTASMTIREALQVLYQQRFNNAAAAKILLHKRLEGL